MRNALTPTHAYERTRCSIRSQARATAYRRHIVVDDGAVALLTPQPSVPRPHSSHRAFRQRVLRVMRSRSLSEHDVALEARLHFSLLHRWCAQWSMDSDAPLGAFVRARLRQWLLRVEADAPRSPSWVPPRTSGAQARLNDFARRIADRRMPLGLNRRCCGLCGALGHSRGGHDRAMAGGPEARRNALAVATGVSAALHRRVHVRFEGELYSYYVPLHFMQIFSQFDSLSATIVEDGGVRVGTLLDARASHEWRVLYDDDGESEWISLPDVHVRVGGVDRRWRLRSAIPAPLRRTAYSQLDAAELRCGADLREVRDAVERVAECDAQGGAKGDAVPRLIGLRASSSLWSG